VTREEALAALRLRLEAKLVRDGDCLLWTGATGTRGYGIFWLSAGMAAALGMSPSSGRLPSGKLRRRQMSTHRLAFRLCHGEIPAGLFVCHRCDRPSCCNPDHLFLGTCADNVSDMRSKDRHARGERSPHAKLTEGQVDEMRRLFASGSTRDELAERFGVSGATAGDAIRGCTWGHMPPVRADAYARQFRRLVDHVGESHGRQRGWRTTAAEELGISKSTITDFLSGNHNINRRTAVRAAETYGLSQDFLGADCSVSEWMASRAQSGAA
jgi:hypothetical protein